MKTTEKQPAATPKPYPVRDDAPCDVVRDEAVAYAPCSPKVTGKCVDELDDFETPFLQYTVEEMRQVIAEAEKEPGGMTSEEFLAMMLKEFPDLCS